MTSVLRPVVRYESLKYLHAALFYKISIRSCEEGDGTAGAIDVVAMNIGKQRCCVLFQVSVAMSMWSSLFWDNTRRSKYLDADVSVDIVRCCTA